MRERLCGVSHDLILLGFLAAVSITNIISKTVILHASGQRKSEIAFVERNGHKKKRRRRSKAQCGDTYSLARPDAWWFPCQTPSMVLFPDIYFLSKSSKGVVQYVKYSHFLLFLLLGCWSPGEKHVLHDNSRLLTPQLVQANLLKAHPNLLFTSQPPLTGGLVALRSCEHWKTRVPRSIKPVTRHGVFSEEFVIRLQKRWNYQGREYSSTSKEGKQSQCD